MPRHLHSKHRASVYAKASGFDKALSQNKFFQGNDVFLAANESHDVLEDMRGWPAFILVSKQLSTKVESFIVTCQSRLNIGLVYTSPWAISR